MSKFKVGDKVRVIQKGHRQFGQVASIVKDDGSDCYPYSLDVQNSDIFDDRGLELVTEQESELERLVRVANEGDAAIRVLKEKYSDEVIDNEGDPVTMYDRSLTFSIKPKPKFEPFTVGEGWKVNLANDSLAIGCKSFDANKFKKFLKGYGSGQELMVQDYPSKDITHTIGLRAGIQFSFRWEKHLLRWEDADKILAALEKAGIK